MTGYMKQSELQAKTDNEIAILWNALGSIFRPKGGVQNIQGSTVGFLQLSRETERRGLEMMETKFGRIILQPKKELA